MLFSSLKAHLTLRCGQQTDNPQAAGGQTVWKSSQHSFINPVPLQNFKYAVKEEEMLTIYLRISIISGVAVI